MLLVPYAINTASGLRPQLHRKRPPRATSYCLIPWAANALAAVCSDTSRSQEREREARVLRPLASWLPRVSLCACRGRISDTRYRARDAVTFRAQSGSSRICSRTETRSWYGPAAHPSNPASNHFSTCWWRTLVRRAAARAAGLAAVRRRAGSVASVLPPRILMAVLYIVRQLVPSSTHSTCRTGVGRAEPAHKPPCCPRHYEAASPFCCGVQVHVQAAVVYLWRLSPCAEQGGRGGGAQTGLFGPPFRFIFCAILGRVGFLSPVRNPQLTTPLP